ncbi:MAG: amidohydrolase family protein [Fulvivirga sp.]
MKRLHNAVVWKLVIILFIGVLPLSLYGQDEKIAPVTGTYAITNVNITQAPGRTIQLGTVVVKDGMITAVGKTVSIPADAKIIKADSMYLYAGFIDGLSHVGVDMPKEEEDQDVDDPSNPPNDIAGIQPDRDVRGLLNPADKSVDDWRKLGFTAAHVVPEGRMLPGSGAIVLLSGDTPDEMVYRSGTSLFSQLRGASGIYPNTVIGVMAKYRDLYRNASYAKSYKQRYEQDGAGMERPVSDRVLEAFYPVIDKRIPVAFKAESVLDIQRVFILKNDLGFNLMLGEVKQGWDVIDKIKSANASVFLSLELPELKEEKEKDSTDTDEGDTKKELTAAEEEQQRLDARKKEMILNHYKQPALFTANGVKFGFSTLEAKSKDIKSNLSKMVENGLSEDAALTALTTAPAQLLGLSNTMGTVDAGKIANLVISDKPYFDEKSNVKMVFVDGKLFEYDDKPKKKKSDGEDIDPIGSWSYSTETPQGTTTGTLKITGEAGDYSGEMTNSQTGETTSISDIAISGTSMTYSFQINAGGNMLSISVSVTIDGETFDGTMTVGSYGSFPVEGERIPEQ